MRSNVRLPWAPLHWLCLIGCLVGLTACEPSEILQRLNQDVSRFSQQENEDFKLITIHFHNEGKESEWFRDSKVAAELNQAIVEGAQQASRQDSRLRFKGWLKSEFTEDFYAQIKAKTDEERRRYLQNFLTENDANFVLFGRFTGDDYKITVMPFAYSATRKTIAKGRPQDYARGEDKRQLYDKVAIQIRDLLLEVMKASPGAASSSGRVTQSR